MNLKLAAFRSDQFCPENARNHLKLAAFPYEPFPQTTEEPVFRVLYLLQRQIRGVEEKRYLTVDTNATVDVPKRQ